MPILLLFMSLMVFKDGMIALYTFDCMYSCGICVVWPLGCSKTVYTESLSSSSLG